MTADSIDWHVGDRVAVHGRIVGVVCVVRADELHCDLDNRIRVFRRDEPVWALLQRRVTTDRCVATLREILAAVTDGERLTAVERLADTYCLDCWARTDGGACVCETPDYEDDDE